MYLVVSFTSDWLYPTYHSKEMIGALLAVGADVTYCDIKSSWGHDAFLLEVDTMTSLISDFLGRVVREHKIELAATLTLPAPLTPAHSDQASETLVVDAAPKR